MSEAESLVLGSLVNAFTNCRNVKGELRQNPSNVMDVTHVSSRLYRILTTSADDNV